MEQHKDFLMMRNKNPLCWMESMGEMALYVKEKDLATYGCWVMLWREGLCPPGPQ